MSDNHFRSSMRFLKRHKGYTGINLLGLTLGLCSCLVIYNIVRHEFSFDQIYPDRDRIYRIGGRIRINNGNGVINESYGKTIPAPAPNAMRSEIAFIDKLAEYYPYEVTVTVPRSDARSPIRLEPAGNTILAGREYFDIFPQTWLAGSAAEALDRPNTVVLTARRARDYFGELPAPQYINRELIYDDTLQVRVSGIIKDYDGNTDFPYTDYISFSTIKHTFLKNTYRDDQWAFDPAIPRIQAFVMLNKNANPKQAAPQFDSVWQRHNTDGSLEQFLKFNIVLQPFEDIHFDDKFTNDGIRKANKAAMYGLIGVALFILLLAIVNYINLSTAQSLQRSKDVSLRRILGASRVRLILTSLMETAIIITLSAIAAFALVRPVMVLFREYLPEDISYNPFTLETLIFTVGSVIITTFLAGLYPAIRLSGQQFDGTLSGTSSHTLSLRRILIVFQYSISLLFIIASLVMSRQVNYMLDIDMGFKSTAVVTVTDINSDAQQLRLFARQALKVPGVLESTLQGHAPAGEEVIQYPMKLDNTPDNGLSVNLQAADHQFIPFYQMHLLAGRNLSPGDSLREFVINETYSRALGFPTAADALGHTLTWQDETHPIVGVVADFHTTSLHTPIPALVIARLADQDNSVGLRVQLSNRQTLPRLEGLWKQLFNDQPFTYSFLDENIAELYKKDQQVSWLVKISTVVTIFVSCIGLLGLVLFAVERKKKEISIRKVLGAGVANIVFLLNKEFMVLIGISLIIASPIALLVMHHWLQGFAYRTTVSWWIFLIAGVITLMISFLTISLRVIRAALANPTKNLRSE